MQIDPISLFLALIAGIITSLLPGLHPNTIGAILTPYFGENDAWPLVLIALLGVRVALQFLPSILVGVPEGDTQISLLPGQRMRNEGRGMEAIGICAFSVVAATTLALLLSPLMMPVLPAMFDAVKPWTGWLLLAATIALLFDERNARKIALAGIVFILAGDWVFWRRTDRSSTRCSRFSSDSSPCPHCCTGTGLAGMVGRTREAEKSAADSRAMFSSIPFSLTSSWACAWADWRICCPACPRQRR